MGWVFGVLEGYVAGDWGDDVGRGSYCALSLLEICWCHVENA